jgi:peptidoglycan/xylan/chitin deacetylase (PgdA/CDA1 family)
MNLVAAFLLAFVRRFKGGGIIVAEHTLTEAQTRFHVQVLSRWFDFIKLEDLPRRLVERSRKPFCLLTFDDGKRSNFSQTAPELERLSVPAIFYLPTEFITKGSYLWFDRRERLLRALGYCPAGLELETLKKLPLAQLTERLDRACSAHDFKLQEDSNENICPMSWDEARNLSQRGFTIGAHGVTHAILTRENKDRAFAEIEESLAKVTSETGVNCGTFAFPNGNHSVELAQYACRCGASSVMTCDPIWAAPGASLLQLPRIQLFGNFSRARIELKVALAAIPGALRNPDGSGRSYRSISRSPSPTPRVLVSSKDAPADATLAVCDNK